jgi:hypothetical protein
MAGRQTKNVFIETQYDNIVLINPNQIADSDGKPLPRLVDNEDMVYYANLETFIIPRTKLAIGESLDNSVINTTIASLNSDPDLKINFLQPKGKKAFDTSWTDQLTGKDSRRGASSNQKFENLTTINGNQTYVNTVKNYEDTQLLGIKTIDVTIKPTGVPTVKIEMVDVQGKMLFEQGENSIYSVFFNFPYPLFYLTLKGYYGKAIRYRLSLLSFNARFDADSGNFNISLELIGKFTALLFDTPLAYGMTAPKMFKTQAYVKENTQSSNIRVLETTKGRIKLDEVYELYKNKKLIPDTLPHYSIDGFLTAISNYETKLLESIKKGDFNVLNDVQRFREVLNDLKTTLYTNALKNYLDSASYYVYDGKIYYPFKKEIALEDREKYKTLTQERITYFINELKANNTFGENKSYKKSDGSTIATEIDVWSKIKDSSIIIKQFPLNQWLENDVDLNNTRYYRTGQKLDLTTQEGIDKLRKFKADELANRPGKVFDLIKNEFVDDSNYMYFYGDKNLNDGTYIPNSFLNVIEDALKQLDVKEEQIDDDLSKVLADRVVNGDGGLGFTPTIRNVFAILFAGVDAFYRLMEDTHQQAWNVRTDKTRLLSVIPPEKSFSVEALGSVQTSSGQLNEQNIVYPWPLYFDKQKQKDGRELYTIQYPGDPKIINKTNGWNTTIWPEVYFVEEYIRGSLTKETEQKSNIFNNPRTNTNLVSPNALFFPYSTLPYQDMDSVSILYETMERSIINSNYNRFNYDVAVKKQVDKLFADFEGQNVVSTITSSIELQNLLREYKFTYPTFLSFLKTISNNGSGKSWITYDQGLFNNQYIINALNEQKEVYSQDTIANSSITISADSPLTKNLKAYLESTDTSTNDILDTFPLNNFNWIRSNVSNGGSLNSISDFYDTTKTFTYLDDKKTIARLNQTEKTNNIGPFVDKYGFSNQQQLYITNVSTSLPINSRTTLKEFFEQRKQKDLYFTESYLNYGNSYSGNVGTKIQTTSILNTPYFINSLLNGVDGETNKDENPYTALGYLYLNSLPLITTKERLKSFTSEGAPTDLDYLASTFKKYSAIHQIPYAWVLKYGSIWHRYKKYINESVDILDNVWKDFDYTYNYDPITSNVTKPYVIPNYTGGQQTIYLQKTEQILSSTGLTVDIITTGFYPRVINNVYKFFNKKDLFTGYTEGAYFKAYTDNKFKFVKNNLANTNLNFGFDPQNTNRSLLKTNYYHYLDTQNVNSNKSKFMLFPSMGGINVDQSIYECTDTANILKKELNNNGAVHNGAVRSLWGASHFGYFDNSLVKKPLPNEYLKVINTTTSEQHSFDITNTESTYSQIDEILSVFNVEMLDKFENEFLTFCDYKPTAESLLLKGEVDQPTYTDSSKIQASSLNNRRLYSQIYNLFFIDKTGVVINNENTDGIELGKKQMSSFLSSVSSFLSFDCVVKNSNPGNFDRKIFESFVTNPTILNPLLYTEDPYIKNTLPTTAQTISLLVSKATNKDAWNALETYVGYSNIDKMVYTDSGSTITDFFVDMNINFNENNVKYLYQLIKMYATLKSDNPNLDKAAFKTQITNLVNSQDSFKEKVLNQMFTYINKNTPEVKLESETQIAGSAISSDTTKLTTYNTLKAFNDKWIAGSDLKSRTLFEDFLFMDRANSDLGDTFIIDMQQVKTRIEANPNQNIMQLISWILKDNYFMFFAMPAYINFYGIQKLTGDNTPKEEITIGNDLFGTHLNVDYLNSSPKFLCLYMGNPSEWPKPKENSFIRFGDDSFDLRISDNPLRVSDPNRDYGKNNKVVGFAVDFGIQNQNIFKNLDLDMSEKKNTAETFKIYAQMGDSVSGDKVAQESVSMYSTYKTRSYSCGVESMGNVMIQPTMYFALRHVPLFYGPYWISEVTHSVNQTDFTTKFTGVRTPKYSLPTIDNLVASVNKSIIKSFKSKQNATNPNKETETEKLLEVDPVPVKIGNNSACTESTSFTTVAFVDLKATNLSLNEITTTIKGVTNVIELRTLLSGLILTRGFNTINNDLIQSSNNNFYQILTNKSYGAELNKKVVRQACASINGIQVPIADFTDFNLSTEFALAYFSAMKPMIDELVKINPNTDISKSYAEAITQLVYTTWDTLKGYGEGVTVQTIKDMTLKDKTDGVFTAYDYYVTIFKANYENYLANP